MRLVTYVVGQQAAQPGVFIDGDQAVLSLALAQQAVHGGPAPELSSVLSLIEAGDEGLAHVRTLIRRAPAAAVLSRSDVRLRAPIR